MDKKIEEQLQILNKKSQNLVKNIQADKKENERVIEILVKTDEILGDLDKQFAEKTELTPVDMNFLFLAIGLQITRQYLLSNDKFRIEANQGDKLMKDMLSPLDDVKPEWKSTLIQSVPYDAIQRDGITYSTGLSGTTHRYRTLGHDPILGWVFGTANIMTSSLTKYDLETFSVKNMKITRHYPLGVTGMMNKTIQYAQQDPTLLFASVARQAVHFGSDYFTKQGLPLPIISTIDNNLAKKMVTQWNIDSYSVSRSMAISSLINSIIGFLHSLFFDGNTEEMEKKLYEVRTRKIITYSNLVASSSNVAVVAITKQFNKLDLGGIAVAIYRLITDAKFIRDVKEEFIFGSYRDLIMGEDI